jgi:hypothetical protein
MKRQLLLPLLLVLTIASCIKKDATTSTTVTASYPTITFVNGRYFSVPLNAPYPAVTISATDSFYNPCDTVVIDSAIHTDVGGLYIGSASAKNARGYISYASFYVAVTSVSTQMNLAGTWWPVIGPLANDSGATQITRLANGLYSTNNIGDVNTYTDAVDMMSGIFAVTNLTTIVFPADNTSYSSPGVLSMIPFDTTITYTDVKGNTYTYKKQ